MSNYIGTKEITKIYLGSTEIKKLDVGKEIILDGGEPTPEPSEYTELKNNVKLLFKLNSDDANTDEYTYLSHAAYNNSDGTVSSSEFYGSNIASINLFDNKGSLGNDGNPNEYSWDAPSLYTEMWFDDSGDYGEVSPSTTLVLVEVWQYFKSNNTDQVILRSNNLGAYMLYYNNTSGNIEVRTNSGSIITSLGSYAQNQWHHIGFLHYNGNVYAVKDGTLTIAGSFSVDPSEWYNYYDTANREDDMSAYRDFRISLANNLCNCNFTNLTYTVPTSAFTIPS